jgi:serine/threonine protein kinase
MGTVFRAKRKTDGKIVALKVLRPSLSRNRRYVERLKREAEISIRLTHHALVKGIEFGEEQGYHFLAMEFVNAKSLKELLGNWGRFPIEQVLDVGKQCAEALQCIHDQGVVHRDIKPGNILIDDGGHVWLTDLGLAKGGEDPSLTRDGATIGTPQYMSPEQARDPASVDERSDLYSLGATLYHMATGQPPFQAETVGKLIHAVLHERIPPASVLNPGLDPGLDLVLRKLLMREPTQRYSNAEELLRDLELVTRGNAPGVNLRAIEKAERPPTFLQRHRLAMAITVITIAGWLVLWSLWPNPRNDKEKRIIGIPHLEKVLSEIKIPRKRLALLETFEPRNKEEKEAFTLLREREYQNLDIRILDFFRKQLGVNAFESWLNRHPLNGWKPAYLPNFIEDLFFREFELLPRDLPSISSKKKETRGGPKEHFKVWLEREEELLRREVGRLVNRSLQHLEERFETSGIAQIQSMERNGEWGKILQKLVVWRSHPERFDPEVKKILPLPQGFDGALDPFRAEISSWIERLKRRAAQQLLPWITQARAFRERIETLLHLGQVQQAFQVLQAYGAFLQNRRSVWRDLPLDLPDPALEEESSFVSLQTRVEKELLVQEQKVLEDLLDGILHICKKGNDFQEAEQLLIGTHFTSKILLDRLRNLAEDLLLAREAGEGILDSLVKEAKKQTFLLINPVESYSGTPFSREDLILNCKNRKGNIRGIPIGRMETSFLVGRINRGDILQGVRKDEEFGLLLFFLERDQEALRFLGRSNRNPRFFLKLSRRRKVFEERIRERQKKKWAGWLTSAKRALEQGRWDQASSILILLPQVFPALERDKEGGEILRSLKRQWERKKHLFALAAQLGEPLKNLSQVQALGGGGIRVTLDFISPVKLKSGFGNWTHGLLGLQSPSPESKGDYREGSFFSFKLPFLDPQKNLRFQLRFRIPRNRGLAGFRLDMGRTRLYFAQAPGETGCFGVLKTGEVLVDGLRYASENSGKAKESWFFVPGLTYNLEIRRIPGRNRKYRFEVQLNGKKLGSFQSIVREKVFHAQIQAAGGLALLQVTCEGKEVSK